MRHVPVILAALMLSSLVPGALALPTPGLFCDASDASLGRLFPEALETNDYVSYDEALCGLDKLQAESPGWIKRDVVGQSVGWNNIAGGHDTFDVFVVRVSNYESELANEDKLRIVFQLSIHGNEKGGREGGLRVIEDLVRDIGFSQTHPELRGYLDYMELLFVFPQPDGWTHEYAEYRHNDACYISLTQTCGEAGLETQNFVRVNGHGVDVNREWPTVGWAREQYTPMSEPEAISLINYLKNESNLAYASDIHGMLNPADSTFPDFSCTPFNMPPDIGGYDPICVGESVAGARGHFVLTMLPAGRQNQDEMVLSTSLAELVKERLNNAPGLAAWNTFPGIAGAWGGEYNDWGTVWDTIGYTDSGFTSDFYAQDTGLNTPGVDFELAYNHISVDNYYPGAGALFNHLHVESVREIVRAFMDQAALDIDLSIDVKGTRTAFLENPAVVTNAGKMEVTGWALENDADDAFDAAHLVYEAAPNHYFEDMQAFVRDGDRPGILDSLRAGDITAARLANYENLIIPGSAYAQLNGNAAAKNAIKAWVENGGNLVLTDGGMQMLIDLGLAEEGSIESSFGYAGYTNFVDREHALAQGIRGLARETYEPVPLGFGVDGFNAPMWTIKASAFDGSVVGVAGSGQGATPDPTLVNYGEIALGSGNVRFLGALLPDPSAESYAPYGIDSYATTYTGNQLLRNMLNWDLTFQQPPKPLEELGNARALRGDAVTAAEAGDDNRVPAPGVALALGALGLLALARRRAQS